MQSFLNIRNIPRITCVRHIVTRSCTPQIPMLQCFNSVVNTRRSPSSNLLNSLNYNRYYSNQSENKSPKTLGREASNSKIINESSSVEDVEEWAKQFVIPIHAEKLKVQEINGKSLLDLDALSLERCGFPVGPASILAKEIEKLKGVAQEFPLFSPSEYSFSFPTFEKNDDYLSLLDRTKQINFVKETIERLDEAPKFEPIVVSTSRGMGKTFFMKKLVKGATPGSSSPVPKIEAAHSVGRIVTMECTQIMHILGNNPSAYNHFWQLSIVCNIFHLFKGRKVDGINFDPISLSDIMNVKDNSEVKNRLGNWICRVMKMSVKDACIEMIRLTKIAFNSNSDVKPVFLVDNIHNISRLVTTLPSKTAGINYTVLSMLLDQLTEYRVPCIVAGTADGQLQLVAEYSNFKPVYVQLNQISMNDAYTMGTEMVEYLNHKYNTSIKFPDNKDKLLLALQYESCQIPRLLKIAFQAWYDGKINSNTDSFIMESFYTNCRKYYEDAVSFITSLTVTECAILMLSCSVNFRMTKFLPSTQLEIRKLVDVSIVFPKTDGTYIIPAFFWLELDIGSAIKAELQNPEAVLSKWVDVQKEMKRLIPGLEFKNLYVYTKKWISCAFSLNDLGDLWEKLIASSLAVKYLLCTLEQGSVGQNLPLLQIYKLGEKAQAHSLLSKLVVNLSKGIITPSYEARAGDNLEPAIYFNSRTPKAHHDIIINNFVIQCKNSLNDPDGGTIDPQLNGCKHLLWFYPGFNEEQKDPPKNYTKESVKRAIDEKRLGFLSGAGCASALAIDMVMILKEILHLK